MISKDCVEAAYCFFHQKWNIYSHSTMENQRDDIEYAIASYVEEMNKELYAKLAADRPLFLTDHTTFLHDMLQAVKKLENMMKEFEQVPTYRAKNTGNTKT